MSVRGFSLIELMIVVAIIGILIAIAIPSYQTYTRRARYTEVIHAAAPYKLGIEECYQMTEDLSACDAGKNGIPANTQAGKGLVESITVNHGAITIIPRSKYGIDSKDTYILTPITDHNRLIWISGGGGVSAGYAK